MVEVTEIEVVFHSLALEGPHVTPAEIINCANMALAFDPNAYFRAFYGTIYIHWRTEKPIKEAING